MANKKLEKLFELSDEEYFAEYEQLTPREMREFKILAKTREEYYKKLTLESLEEIKVLENELKQKNEEYERLKRLN